MKHTFKTLVISALALMAAGCSIDVIEPDQNGLPVASELVPEIVVDQETNMVTFSVSNPGLVPVWIFGEELIDGKKSKSYCYAKNGVTLRFREAGEHTVELKAYNANGISVGSQLCTFTLNETYRDPFDATPYIRAISGGTEQEWMWNSTVDGHFGCGPSGTDGLEWWSAKAGEKADFGLYDDRMTFTLDGVYKYNPGDGKVYVNKDSGYKTEFKTADEDYMADIDAYESTYYFENSWNDAGIEEIYLVLASGSNLSYIPNPEALTNPKWRVLASKTSEMKKTLKLAIDNGSIAWHYQLVPAVHEATDEEKLAGTAATGKTWIYDSKAPGHLACGPEHSNPAGWWAAKADEKDGFGVYDDEVTFFPDGKYVFNPGEGGTIYVNKDVSVGGPGKGPGTGSTAGEDYQLAWTVQESTYTFDGETITLPEGIALGYMANNDAYTNPVYSVTELTETNLTLVVDYAGISWQYKFKAKDAPSTPDEPGDDEEEVYYDINGAGNLYKSATITQDHWYSGADWSGGITPDVTLGENNSFVAVIPEGVGGSEWMAQTKFRTGVATSEEKVYDFCATLLADKDMTITIKVTGYPEGEGDTHAFFYNGSVKLLAGEELVFKMPNIKQAASCDNLLIIYDFGRSPIGSKITVTDICFQEHRASSFDINGAGNLYKSATITQDHWYSGADWSGGITPDITLGENNSFVAVIPEGVGGSEWMAQTKFRTGVATSEEKAYDFCATLLADKDMTITIKVTGYPEGEGDTHAFFYDGSVKLLAGEELVYKKKNLTQVAGCDNLLIIYDFGRSPIGSKITVTDICFQEHK